MGGRDIDLEQVVEEWVACGLVEKRRRPDGTVEYCMTDKGKRLGGPPPAITEALFAKPLGRSRPHNT